MFKEKLFKVIEEIQAKYKDIQEYPEILDVCDPGQTGFKCKSIGATGYLLLSPIKVPQKKRILIGAGDAKIEDFMGVHPFIMVVMESGSESCKPGDIVMIEQSHFQNMKNIVVKAALAVYAPDSVVQGVDSIMTELVSECEIIKTVADA